MPLYFRVHAGPFRYSTRLTGGKRRRTYTPRYDYTPREPRPPREPMQYRARSVAPHREHVRRDFNDRWRSFNKRWFIVLGLALGYAAATAATKPAGASAASGFLLLALIGAVVWIAVGTWRRKRKQSASQEPAGDDTAQQQPEPQAKWSNRR